MEISYTKHTGEHYTNCKIKKKEFANIKERMTYIINFLNERATAKTTKDNPSHLKGARFMFLKPAGNFFDEVSFTIPGTKDELDNLMDIVFGK